MLDPKTSLQTEVREYISQWSEKSLYLHSVPRCVYQPQLKGTPFRSSFHPTSVASDSGEANTHPMASSWHRGTRSLRRLTAESHLWLPGMWKNFLLGKKLKTNKGSTGLGQGGQCAGGVNGMIASWRQRMHHDTSGILWPVTCSEMQWNRGCSETP